MADTLHEWIGRQQQASDEVSLASIKRLAALLDAPLRPYRRGDAIPKGWYVVLFTPEERQSLLGPDGHPHKGQFIPPVPLPRRMFAGRDRKSTRLNSSHGYISYAVFCLKKKTTAELSQI